MGPWALAWELGRAEGGPGHITRRRGRRLRCKSGRTSAARKVHGGLGVIQGGGYRVGEASNPGPPMVTTILTANVTSWGSVPGLLAEAEDDVVLVQEHRQRGTEARRKVTAEAKRMDPPGISPCKMRTTRGQTPPGEWVV